MNRNLEWHDGAPDEIKAGMYIEWELGFFELVGTLFVIENEDKIKRWAWLVKPHELEWLETMAKTNAKGRPEQ